MKYKTKARATLQEITPIELDTLKFIAHGLSNAQIAKALQVPENTVRTKYVYYLKQKLGTDSRVLLAIYAIKKGYVALEDIKVPDKEELMT